jgi:hypothetical protein
VPPLAHRTGALVDISLTSTAAIAIPTFAQDGVQTVHTFVGAGQRAGPWDCTAPVKHGTRLPAAAETAENRTHRLD